MLDAVERPDSSQPVPTELSAELQFRDDVSASFYCSFRTHHQQWAHLSGDAGTLHVADFVLPYFGSESTFEVGQADFVQDGCDFNMERRARRIVVQGYSNSHVTSPETNMIRTFSGLALSGQPDAFWPDVSFKTQQVLDACYLAALENKSVELPAI
jgi:predicted dehydrogenase